MAIRRKADDDAFSKCIRLRSDYVCERCEKDYKDNPGSLHASHFFGRRRLSTRFDPHNAASHCVTCHQYLGENPIKFAKWIESYVCFHYGELAYADLVQRQSEIVKLSKVQRKELTQRLRASQSFMEQQRREGVEGRIDFESPYER